MSPQTILIVGASRGIGHAMAAEFLKKGWNVIGTVRGDKRTLLHDLADSHHGQDGDSSSSSSLTIKQLDMCAEDQIARLRADLEQSNVTLDMLFINAGTTNKDPTQRIGQVSTQEFIEVMVTNALSPMRVLESLQGLVRCSPGGLLGIMSSGQGSLTNNVAGQREVYRGTKAALNMYMKSFAAREMQKEQQQKQGQGPRAMVLMAPGWIKTQLGGAGARLTLEETIPSLVNVLLEKQARPGLEYLDYQGKTVPW